MKNILLVLLLSLVFCGCAKKENSLVFPTVQYAKEPMVTIEPMTTPIPANLPSKLKKVSVMDRGYTADVVAALGNRILSADIDSRDYQLVWAKFSNNTSNPVPIEGKVIREDREEQAADESRIYDAVAGGHDAFFYVILGEMSRFTFTGAGVIENTEYSGRYRIEKYDMDGELIDSLSISELPADTVMEIVPLPDGKLFVLGGIQGIATEINDAVIGKDVFMILDLENGDILSRVEREGNQIRSIAASEEELYAFIYPESMSDSYYAIIDPVSGKETKLPIAWNHGMFDMPFCVQCADIGLSNGDQFCVYWPNSRELMPMVNLRPDSEEELEIVDIFNRIGAQVTSACVVYDSVVIAIHGLPELIVISPL